ncbi:MAG TPA: hypothetical protein VFZ58_01170 [Candidatus Saccharimonadales bacterium]
MPEKVLVVGRTGRDMALAEAIGKSDEVERFFAYLVMPVQNHCQK